MSTPDSVARTPRPGVRYVVLGFVTAAAGAFLARRYPALLHARHSSALRIFHPFHTSTSITSLPSISPSSSAPFSTTTSTTTTSTITMSSTMYGGGIGRTVPSRESATAAVIFMHGLGDTADGWASMLQQLNLDHVRVVLPTAEMQPVTLNMGMRMHSWFDISSLDENANDDREGIANAVARVERIITDLENEGISSRRVVVAGFSQGGATALATGMRCVKPLAGVIALSSWLPMRDSYSRREDLPPVFMGHGTADNVVAFPFGEKSMTLLQSLGAHVEFKGYPGMGHSSSDAEMMDVRTFVKRVLPKEV